MTQRKSDRPLPGRTDGLRFPTGTTGVRREGATVPAGARQFVLRVVVLVFAFSTGVPGGVARAVSGPTGEDPWHRPGPALARLQALDSRGLGLGETQRFPRLPPAGSESGPAELDRLTPTLTGLARSALELMAAETDHPNPPHADALEWAPVSVHRTPRRTYVHYRQMHRGLPILETRITLQWTADGEFSHLRGALYAPEPPTPASRAASDTSPDGRRGDLSETIVRKAALEGLETNPEATAFTLLERAWLPLAETPGKSGSPALQAVWHVRVSTDTPPGDWRCLVDASSGELIARDNQLLHASVSGTITGRVEPVTSGDVQVELPFPHLQVNLRQGSEVSLATRTDEDGAYTFEVAEGSEWTWQAELRGRGAWVRDVSRSLFTPLVSLDEVAPGDRSLRWDDNTSSPATRDAYYHATAAYDFIRALDPGETLAALDQGVQVRVDDTSGVCNAFWNGTYLNFYASGGGCVATARIADVVYHEYGHAVTHHLYFPFLPPRDMNEAWSDYFAATLTGDSRIGRGLLGPAGTFLRDLAPDRVWPVDSHPDPHIRGLILGGALWDLRTELGAEITDLLFHYARYGLAQSFDEFLYDLLLYDDDDNDLSNGSPHFGTIIRTFGAHGVGDYTVRLAAAQIPDIEQPGPYIDAEVRIDALLGLDPEALRLYVATGDTEFQSLPLEPTETPRLFLARIPTPDDDTELRYYWAAADTADHTATLPDGAPAETFSFYVGPDRVPPELAHTPTDVVTADLPRLTIRALVRDNTGRLGPVRAELRDGGGLPTGLVELHPGSSSESGTEYVGAIELGGFSAGDAVHYRLLAEDAAALPNLTSLPPQGDYRVEVRRGRSFDLEDGPGPFEVVKGWSWGVPAPPLEAWSGARVWATELEGVYPNADTAALQLGPFDLRTFDRATLQFEHFYRFEAGFDGGRLLVSENDGATWRALTPAGGYPSENVATFGEPGFSGASPAWSRAEFPLDTVLDRDIWLRWEVRSDPFVSDLGWYIDDVSIVERQSRAGPLGLRVRDQDNQRVELRWEAPIGVDLSSPRFLGFRLYRTPEGEPFPDAPIGGDLLDDTRYVDLDVENDVTYRYRLVAVYDEGESAAAEATATPAAPTIGFETAHIDFELRGQAQSDTIVTVRNLSGGRLEFDAFLAEDDWTIDDTRLALDLETLGEDPLTLVDDPRDASGPADLAQISAQRITDEAGSRLRFRLRSHRTWNDPLDDFGGILLIDTDQSLTSSQGAFTFGWNEDLNMGWEYAVVFGRLPREFGSAAPALLYQGCCPERLPVVLTDAVFPENADELSFAMALSDLDFPSRIHVSVLLTRRLSETPFDRAPELPDVPWLIREPKHGRVRAHSSEHFSFEFDARALKNGDYHARVFLETNDLAQPLIDIPVTLRVRELLPQNPADLRLDSEPDGMRIGFASPAGFTATAAEIERFQISEAIWRRITPQPLVPDSTGAFEFLDTTAISGEVYRYRFRVLFDDGLTVVFGPYQISYTPPVPAALGLEFRSVHPFQSTVALRLGLPANAAVEAVIFDPGGRRVRRLVQGEYRAGLHALEWNGRDDRGADVASGIYFLRLRVVSGSSTEERLVRLVRVR